MAQEMNKAEKYAVRWFKKEGYNCSIERTSCSKTLFKVGKDNKETLVEVPYTVADLKSYFTLIGDILKIKLG